MLPSLGWEGSLGRFLCLEPSDQLGGVHQPSLFSSFPVCCVLAHIHTWDESMGFLSAGRCLLWMELSWLLLVFALSMC